MIFRPFKINEAWWAIAAAALIVVSRTLSPDAALSSVREGTNVYLFLVGMMILAEIARDRGVFDWLACEAVDFARGSASRLFALVFGVGAVVTILLSNDATVVVLTPAVLAAVRRARAQPLPYLYACAFIANAASFVLPISNPANLVVYGAHLPPLGAWLATFGVASIGAIAATFLVSRAIFHRDLQQDLTAVEPALPLTPSGRVALGGIVVAAALLLAASLLRVQLGLVTFAAAIVLLLVIATLDRAIFASIPANISWSVLPLVAGLFVVVNGIEAAGGIAYARDVVRDVASQGGTIGAFAAAGLVTLLCNVANNLPVGLLSGATLQGFPVPASIRDSVLVGVDLGPNISVTGSLATILWLSALRRENLDVGVGQFLRVGIPVAIPALLVAVLIITIVRG